MAVKKITVAGNEIIEVTLPKEICNRIYQEAMRQFDEYYNHRPMYFRTPADIKNPAVGPGYQWEANIFEDTDTLRNVVLEAAEDFYAHKFQINEFWYLLQRKEAWIKNPKHQHLTADYMAISYINIKEGESAIEFYNKKGKGEIFYPKNHSIIFSKGDVTHRPIENKSEYDRLSLNFSLNKQEFAKAEEMSLKESEKRMQICKQCPKLNSLNFCNECACFMPLKTKMSSATCPIGKW